MVGTFNASTRAAESGIERLRTATEGSGRQIQRQIDTATTLKEDLTFLVQRAEGIADRLDEQLRVARPAMAAARQGTSRYDQPADDEPRVRSQAERDLLKALRMVK
jgi:hypothetical protein